MNNAALTYGACRVDLCDWHKEIVINCRQMTRCVRWTDLHTEYTLSLTTTIWLLQNFNNWLNTGQGLTC